MKTKESESLSHMNVAFNTAMSLMEAPMSVMWSMTYWGSSGLRLAQAKIRVRGSGKASSTSMHANSPVTHSFRPFVFTSEHHVAVSRSCCDSLINRI
jgi:hypothetical protein